ncbi:hypothetical protein RLOC_00014018 [Lonchura striata]|uniref:Uncharacterized protein n=1 Tax=Lonchura striata TaxID=40157 RepID=A0A218UJL2_9PASE|nr:hypothetical protein RLOC_00014018 [Lonchura striata domestica]
MSKRGSVKGHGLTKPSRMLPECKTRRDAQVPKLKSVFEPRKMSQIRRTPGHFVLSSYPNGAPEEEIYSNLQTVPDTTEQMEFDISSATQVGRQLALMGDEFNRRHHRTLEETLLHLARV